MDNLVRINASAVVSSSGDSIDHSQEFYINGKWMDKFWTDNITTSADLTSRHHLFSVYDGMTAQLDNKSISISIARELKRLQQKFDTSTKSIDIKLDQLCECVDETNNLIHSIEVTGSSHPVSASKRSMAGVLVFDGSAAVVTFGNARAFIYHDGRLRLMNEDFRKAERLIRAGLISDEQALTFKGKVISTADEIRKDVKKSKIIPIKDGDMIILCCNKLSEALDEDYLLQLLMHNDDTSKMASLIIKKARENGAQGTLSLLLARIEKSQCSMGTYSDQHCFDELTEEKMDPVRRYGKRSKSIIKSAVKKSAVRKSVLKSAVRKISIFLIVITLIITSWAFGKTIFSNGIKNVFSFVFGIGDSTGKPSETHNIGVTAPTSSVEQNDISTQNDGTDVLNQNSESNLNQAIEDEDNIQEKPTSVGSSSDRYVSGQENVKQHIYTIVKGDTLEGISKKVYNDRKRYEEILRANKGLNPNVLKIGQEIIIP